MIELKKNKNKWFNCCFCDQEVPKNHLLTSANKDHTLYELIFCNFKCFLKWIKNKGDSFLKIEIPYLYRSNYNDFISCLKTDL